MGDDELLERYYEGDDQAFDVFFSRWFKRLKSFFRHRNLQWYEEDLALETLFRVGRSRHHLQARFQPEHGTPLNVWVLVIARNLAYTQLEKIRKAGTAQAWTELPPESGERQPSDWVDQCLERLPTEARHILSLWADEELDRREIAATLQLTYGTAARRLRDARKLLAAEMRDRGFRVISRGSALPRGAFILRRYARKLLIIAPNDPSV